MKKLVLSCVVLLAPCAVMSAHGAPQLLVERGHSAGIEAMAFAPDGKILASASQDGSVRLWDESGAWQSTLLAKEGIGGPVIAIVFSPDGTSLAAGGRDGKVYLWPVPSKSGVYGTPSRVLKFGDGTTMRTDSTNGLTPSVASPGDEALADLVFSRDGNLLAASGYFGHSEYAETGTRLRVWNAHDGTSLWTKTDTDERPSHIAFEGADTLVATRGPGQVQRLDRAGQELGVVTIPEEPARAKGEVLLALSPDGTRVLAKGKGDYKIYDTKSGQPGAALAANPQETPARTQRRREQVEQLLGRPVRERPTASPANLLGTPVGARFSPDGKKVAVAFRQTVTRVWNVEDGQEITASLAGNHSLRGVLALSPQGVLALDNAQAGAGLWQEGELKSALPHASYAVQALDIFSRGGVPILLIGTGDGALVQWNLATGKIEQVTGNAGRDLTALAVSPDGRILAVAEYLKSYTLSLQQRGVERGRLRAIDLTTGGVLWTRGDGGRSKISRLKFSRDSSRLWLAGEGRPGRSRPGMVEGEGFGALEVLDAGNGQSLPDAVQVSDEDGVFVAPQMELSQNESCLAIGGGNFLRVWDLPQGKLRLRVSNPGRNPNLLALSPTGNRLAYIKPGNSSVVRIWDLTSERDTTHRRSHDVADAQGRAALPKQDTPAMSVVAYADGGAERLFAGDARGRLLMWDENWQGKDVATLPAAFLEDEGAVAVTALHIASERLFPNLVLTGHADGTVRLWDLKNKKPLMTLAVIPKPSAAAPRILNLQAPEGPAVTLEDFDWICWTPDGFYNASPGGETLVRWRAGEVATHAPQDIAARRSEEIVPRVLEKFRAN